MARITEIEAGRIVDAELGEGYGVVRIGGYWLIGRVGPGHKWLGPVAQRTKLDLAIRDARTIPDGEWLKR